MYERHEGVVMVMPPPYSYFHPYTNLDTRYAYYMFFIKYNLPTTTNATFVSKDYLSNEIYFYLICVYTFRT